MSKWVTWHTTASHVDSVAEEDMITNLMLIDSYFTTIIQARKCTVNVLWLITRDQAARLTSCTDKKRWAELSILAHILHSQVMPVYSHNQQCVTKRTAESQKKKNSDFFFEVPTLKPKETGNCVKCKRFRGSGDHPSSDYFVRLDTRSKFIAMGRRLEF